MIGVGHFVALFILKTHQPTRVRAGQRQLNPNRISVLGHRSYPVCAGMPGVSCPRSRIHPLSSFYLPLSSKVSGSVGPFATVTVKPEVAGLAYCFGSRSFGGPNLVKSAISSSGFSPSVVW